MRVCLALLVLALAACADPELGREQQEISNGEPAPDLNAAVALLLDGATFCTGTVIAPRVVVTAAHCIAALKQHPGTVEVFFGSRVDRGGVRIATTDLLANPNWSIPTLVDDVAVVGLATDAPVAPIPMRRRPLTDADLHRPVTLIGFGETTPISTDLGVRLAGTAPLVAFDDKQLATNGGESAASNCGGDSGGPSLLDDGSGPELVGIHSRGSCRTLAIDERVDVHVDDFIEPFVADHPGGGCTAAGGGPGGATLLLISLGLALTGGRSRCRRRARAGCWPDRSSRRG